MAKMTDEYIDWDPAEEELEEYEDEVPEDWEYMGLDDTGLPYWHENNVGFHYSE